MPTADSFQLYTKQLCFKRWLEYIYSILKMLWFSMQCICVKFHHLILTFFIVSLFSVLK